MNQRPATVKSSYEHSLQLFNICPELRRLIISMEWRKERRMKRVKMHRKQGPPNCPFMDHNIFFAELTWTSEKKEYKKAIYFRDRAGYFWGLKRIAWLWGGRDRRFSSNNPAFGENFLSFTVRIRSLHHLINTSSLTRLAVTHTRSALRGLTQFCHTNAGLVSSNMPPFKCTLTHHSW